MTFRFSGYPDRYKPAFGHMVHSFGRSGTGGLGVSRARFFSRVTKVCERSCDKAKQPRAIQENA